MSESLAGSTSDAARRIAADIYGLVSSFSQGPTGSSSNPSTPTSKMLRAFEKNLEDTSSIAGNQSHDINDMVLNKKVFTPLAVITADSVSSMLRYLNHDTNIYQRMSNELLQLFAVHKVEYVNDKGKKVKDTVYNREEIKETSNRMLAAAATEILLLGYTVFAVKRDIIGHCTKESLYHDASSPSRSTTGGHRIGGRAANRVPYSSAQDGSCILPYRHLDINGGNLYQYRNNDEGTFVFAYKPVRADIKAMEKNFRFFVVVNPNEAMVPSEGIFRTGIGSVYQAWSRWRLMLTTYEEAVSYLSKPIIYSNYQPGKINVDGMTAQEQAALHIRIGRVSHDMSEQDLEEKLVMINSKAATPGTARLVSSLLMRGANLNKKTGALTEVRADVRNGLQGITNGGLSAGSMQAITSLEHDKYEYDRLDRSRIAGNMRGEHLVTLPPGLAIASVSQPAPNIDSVIAAYNAYNEQLSSLFALLTQTSGISMSTGKSNNTTSTQIQANEVEHMRSESEAMYIIKYIFRVVYVEWGAVLDQIGPIEVMTLINESLRSIRMVGAVRDYIAMKAVENDITLDVLLDYLAQENTRRLFAVKTSAKTNKNAAAVLDSATKADKLIVTTLDNFQQWDTVMRSYQGLSRLFAVLYRTMSASSDGNLNMEFKPTMIPTPAQGGAAGGSSALKPPTAPAFPAPGEG